MAYAGISRPASADDQVTSSGIDTLVGEHGPGMVTQSQADGTSSVQVLPTFRRWDGIWLRAEQMDLAADDWPYRLRDVGGVITDSTIEGNLTQAKIPGAKYEFLPDRIKETTQLTWMTPPVAINDIGDMGVITAFSTDLSPTVDGLSVVLKDRAGSAVWRTAPFVAWDSSEPATMFDEPVVSVELRDGFLDMRLNATMLATAQWPVYLDPTWTLSAAAGWGSSRFSDG